MVLTSKDISVVKYLSRKYAEDTVKGLGILFGIHIIGTILLIMMSSSEEIPSIALGFWSNFPLAFYLMGALFIISATNYEIFAFLNQNGISRKTLWKNKMIVLGLGTLILVLIGTIYDAMVSNSGTNDLIAITYLKGTNPVVKAIGSYLFDVLVTFMTVTWISAIGAACGLLPKKHRAWIIFGIVMAAFLVITRIVSWIAMLPFAWTRVFMVVVKYFGLLLGISYHGNEYSFNFLPPILTVIVLAILGAILTRHLLMKMKIRTEG